MPDAGSFQDVMQRLEAGEEDAAAELFNRFTHRLIGLARKRLDTQVRQKNEPEDVLQSVWKSFFRRQGDGRFDFDGWDGLWALLVVITLRKCGRKIESLQTAARDILREVQPGSDADTSGNTWEAAARDPSPSEVVALTDTVDSLMRELTERERQILMMRLQGYTVPEIAAEISRTERTVFRDIERIRTQLEYARDLSR